VAASKAGLLKYTWEFRSKVFLIAIFEILGNVCSVLGIIYAGSGVYQVVYSSLVVFTAVWARIFLKKHISQEQWCAILTVTIGLSLSAVGTPTSSDSSSWMVTMGALFTLAATTLYSFVYILSENILTQKNAPTPQQLQTLDGVYVAILVTAYLVCYTIPNFETLVLDEVREADGNWTWIICTYLALVLSGFLHSLTYFRLLGSVGSVSTGILNSLRAISVFGMSALLFCNNHPNQCFTLNKGASAVVVICGVLFFSRVSAGHSKVKKVDGIEEIA
jgi:drug/metabolite transporter (DMT)-like permease